jgi:hypothetical protein
MRDPEQALIHGRATYVDHDTDAMRRERCLCLRCATGVNGTKTCPVAKVLYRMCIAHAMAMMITRCGSWAALPKGGEGCEG